jgi:hypothetical protein
VWRGHFSAPILYSRGGHTTIILRMGEVDDGGMNIALLFFGCRRLRISNGWESTQTSLVDTSVGEARSLDSEEVASHHSFRRWYRVTQETELMKSNRNLTWLLFMLREFDSGFTLYSYS